MYTETKEAGRRSEAAVDKFAPGEYYALLVAPLDARRSSRTWSASTRTPRR